MMLTARIALRSLGREVPPIHEYNLTDSTEVGLLVANLCELRNVDAYDPEIEQAIGQRLVDIVASGDKGLIKNLANSIDFKENQQIQTDAMYSQLRSDLVAEVVKH